MEINLLIINIYLTIKPDMIRQADLKKAGGGE